MFLFKCLFYFCFHFFLCCFSSSISLLLLCIIFNLIRFVNSFLFCCLCLPFYFWCLIQIYILFYFPSFLQFNVLDHFYHIAFLHCHITLFLCHFGLYYVLILFLISTCSKLYHDCLIFTHLH